jgi:hypothetical protein
MKLLNIIYHSLEKPNEIIDQIWYDRVERVLATFKSGKVQGILGGDRLSIAIESIIEISY